MRRSERRWGRWWSVEGDSPSPDHSATMCDPSDSDPSDSDS